MFFVKWYYCASLNNHGDPQAEEYILLGFGFANLMFGGIILFSRANIAFIRLVIPEAPSEWPTFGFTRWGSVRSHDVISENAYRANKHTSFPEHVSYCCGLYGVPSRSTCSVALARTLARSLRSF